MSGSHPPYPDELARQRRRLVGKSWRMEEEGPRAGDDRKNGGLHRIYSHRSTVSRPRLLLRIALAHGGTFSLHWQHGGFTSLQARHSWLASSDHLQALIA
ncbi:hypothetical protein QR685DRAFT_575248 [Neurospora intermedia]|uniref:Uncharacterized protein n=1 Tax=Neurospora intermedia TaxID=5142 RepID=A0ABR3D1Q1_NEUIN